jgi:hypothetical protein
MPQLISQITAMALKDNMLDLDACLMFKSYIYKYSNLGVFRSQKFLEKFSVALFVVI